MDVKIIRTKGNRRGHVGGFIFEAKKHILMLMMFVLLFSGLILGNFIVSGNENIYESVRRLFTSYVNSLDGQTFIKYFFQNFVVNGGIILINLLFGLCAVGFPVPLISLLTKGISIGALSSYMYGEFTLKGFGYCMLVIYPVQIISCLILLKMGQESITMSVSILKILTEKKLSTSGETDLRRYMIRFIVLIIFCFFLSAVSSVMSLYVTRLFNF